MGVQVLQQYQENFKKDWMMRQKQAMGYDIGIEFLIHPLFQNRYMSAQGDVGIFKTIRFKFDVIDIDTIFN